MNVFKLNTISSLVLMSGALFAGNASAALSGADTASMTFSSVSNATYGWANEANNGSFIGGCQNNKCYLQNGIVAGVVKDPIDSSAHFHKAGSGAATSAQYHPDSSGIYVRMDDLSSFSLQSLDLNMLSTTTGGSFVLYGYSNAINADILSDAGSYSDGADNVTKFNPTDPDGGLVPHIASYTIANDSSFSGTISLAQLTTSDADWSNIGAFWITMQGFNHSQTESYPATEVDGDGNPTYPYPGFDLRVDNIVLGAASPVPVPGAVWLFGTGLLGLLARSRKTRA